MAIISLFSIFFFPETKVVISFGGATFLCIFQNPREKLCKLCRCCSFHSIFDIGDPTKLGWNFWSRDIYLPWSQARPSKRPKVLADFQYFNQTLVTQIQATEDASFCPKFTAIGTFWRRKKHFQNQSP